MKRPSIMICAALLPGAAGAAGAADARHPTVVELFQNQGCSSCPPWTGKAASYALPQHRFNDPKRRLAVLVQQGKGGPIVAAERI